MSDVRTESSPTLTEDRSSPRGDFIWYELMTSDPEGAKAFYDALVGWNIGEGSAEYGGYRMIGRSDGKFAGGILPLNDEMQQHGARPMWLGYLYVDDVDAAVASIQQEGGKTYIGPADIPNVGRVAMVADPQGAAIYVMKPLPREDEQSDVFSPSAQQRVGWNELSTSDPAAARRFYGKQFGWGSDEFMDMGEMGEYRFLDQNGVRIGALCGTTEGHQPKWRYYIRVPSISAAKQAAEENGGTIAIGPHQVPTGDYIIIGFDPQGAEFALVGGQ